MNHLSFSFELKDVSRRQFSGYAAAYECDLCGDVIKRGAFARTLGEWKSEGHVIPLLDNHPRPIRVADSIGKLMEAEETDKGLYTTFQLVDGPEGVKYARRVKGGLVKSLSIGYRVASARPPVAAEAKSGVRRVLEDVDLEEVSLVLRPMNPKASIGMKAEMDLMDATELSELKSWLDEKLKTPLPVASESESVVTAIAESFLSDEEKDVLRDELLAFQMKQTINAVTT
jgi:uncharacterized protein